MAEHRTLVVMRHAKAEPDAPTDYERPLAPRGLRDAADAGRWLAARGVQVEHALVSAALRTTQTWEAVAEAAGWTVEPDLDRGLYAADVETALDLVRAVDDAVRCVVVVGHNPTTAQLAHLLDDGEGDVEAGNEMAMGSYPTSAVAVFDVGGSWADLGASGASLTAYHVGRD